MARDLEKDAPDPKAMALANRIVGNRTPVRNDMAVMELLISGATQSDDDSEPKKQQSARAQEQEGGAEEDDDLDDIDLDGDELDGDDPDGDEADDDANTEGAEGDEEGDEDDDEEGDEDDYETVPYSDDDEFDVMVDGKAQTVTLKDLKAAFSGEGAISKRLQEATETRKAAAAEREQVQQEINQHRLNLLRTVATMDSALFAPMVEPPDETLIVQGKNGLYLAQKRAYEDDQKRITEGRAAMATFLKKEQTDLQEGHKKYRDAQMNLLVEKMPELRDPVKGKKVEADILEAAKYYGFTEEQVAKVDNHALFLMARDAARYLNMKKLKEGRAPTGRETVTTARRRLKPGTASSAKAKTVATTKARQDAAKTARRTGKVDDVANMLLANARTGKPKRK